VSLFATEKVPQPVVMDATVINDPAARTLTVKLGENASGYQKLQFREAWWGLVSAVQSGWITATPTVWAHGVGERDIAFAVPDPDRPMLLFHFVVGKTAYGELVSRPRLAAVVSVDRSTGRFIGVRFLHRP
jgi:hypothetical protein